MEKELKAAATADYSQLHAVNEGCIYTVSGRLINLRDPKPEEIRLVDVAYGMGNNCRFGGQTRHFWSICQHLIVMYHLVKDTPRLLPYVLLHDATEAYLHDVTKPLKVILGSVYTDIERKWHVAICKRFALDPDAPEWLEIKEYDHIALELEHDWMQRGLYSPVFLKMNMESAWSPQLSREQFLHYAHLLNIQ